MSLRTNAVGRTWLAGAVLGLLCTAAGCNSAPEVLPADASPALREYAAHIKPVLQRECYKCHAGWNRQSDFRMDTRARLLAGGKHGTAVVPGDAQQSLLVQLIRHEGPVDHPMAMPAKNSDGEPGDKLSDRDIAAITQWVADGAVMDR